MPSREPEGAPKTRDARPWAARGWALGVIVVVLAGAPTVQADALLDGSSDGDATLQADTSLQAEVQTGGTLETDAEASGTTTDTGDADTQTVEAHVQTDATADVEASIASSMDGTGIEAELGAVSLLDATLSTATGTVEDATASTTILEGSELFGPSDADGDPPAAGHGGSHAEQLSAQGTWSAGPGQDAASTVTLVAPAALTGLTLVGLALARIRDVAPWLLSPLYTRLKDDELLDHDERRSIYEMVQTEPGLSVSEVMERRGTAWGQTVYHLERLTEAGLLDEEPDGRYRRFYPVGLDPGEREAVGLLREESPRRIVEHLVENPASIQKEIASAVGLASSTVSKHLRRLEERGLVERAEDGRCVRYRTTMELSTLMERMPVRADDPVLERPQSEPVEGTGGVRPVA